MSRIISELLGATEPMFSIAVKQLEQASGKPGVDVRLTGEIIGQVIQKTKELGLDPKDTTGKELYSALLAQYQKHDAHLAKALGGKDAEDVKSLMPLMKKAAEDVKFARKVWVLKKSVAKEFLKKTPPPSIMKILGYKSIDSMLKTENIFEIYGALRFAENPEWLNNFDANYDNLKPSDFEERNIEIVTMPADRWGDISENFVHKKRHNITHVKEMGIILMLPVKQEKIPGITTTVMPLLLHYMNEIKLYSTYFKLQQVRPDFAKVFIETLIADPGEAAVMAGQKIHWRVIQRYFGKLENEYHPEIFEPHVQPEDLHWRKAEHLLYEIDPELGWWRDLDYVGVMHAGRPVTFNLMDIAVSYSTQTPYKDRAIYHFRDSLWNEVFERYMGEKTLEQQVLKQLNNSMIDPESIPISAGGRGF
ncbi:hypothetical protein KA025_02280 [Candidatus Saccharibacteria bacterium]|jgi:hypothetical protein|nr:hypothetical protein [Candidatus Saccharibacteria bacterium]MBP7834891.1 hypothetical protein [Candidatus Saccharibacteria bacterium]